MVEGIGAAGLGNPTRSLAWLARKLRSFGVKLLARRLCALGLSGRTRPGESGGVFVLQARPDALTLA